MVLLICGIFVSAVIVDIFNTRYMRYVTSGKHTHAAFMSGIITICSLTLWGIVLHKAETLGFYGIVAYASGASVGTFIGARKKWV